MHLTGKQVEAINELADGEPVTIDHSYGISMRRHGKPIGAVQLIRFDGGVGREFFKIDVLGNIERVPTPGTVA